MLPTEEENFPRGGRKVNLPLKRPKQDDNLFSTTKSPKTKKTKRIKKSQKENITEETFHSSLSIQGTLSYSKIQDGLIILGCVRHITNFSLEVELPGLTFGSVNITNISDPFTKYLNRKLEDNDEESDVALKKMFKIGQFILVKVLSIEHREKGLHVECTINPRDINQEKSHDSFKKGMLIWASIQSVLDHGYELNTGVKNCRVFLPSKNVNEGKVFTIGEPLWCTIHKSESASLVTTLRVSSKDQHIKATKIEEISGLHDVIPGMQIELVTEKITSHGIQGKFLNDYFGYVDETQLKYPLKKLEDYKEGKLIPAFVLYIEQATKITHLTLRNLDPVPPPSHATGDIVSAEVISKVYNGIYLKLSTNEKCFVTNKRIINSLPTSSVDVSQAIQTKFPVGSKHNCRILDYNHITRIYVCTVEQSLLKEKLFSSKDVKLGQLLNVTVAGIKPEGLIVASGHVRGFVPNIHITNVNYSDNLKKKFKEGYTTKARVLKVDDDNIIFTLKPSLVESDQCLTELEQAKRGDQYTGVVVQTKPAGALVIFYGNVKGWLNKQHLDGEKDNKPDPTEYFYRGQVVNPWVLGIKEDKVILSLKQSFGFKAQERIKIGQRITGIISKIHKDRIDIKSSKGKIVGVLPINHLSCTQSLCSVILKTFKTGDEIKDLLCIDNKNYPAMLSRRESIALNCRKIKLKKFENLKPGNLIRCSYISDCEAGIYVMPLILNYTENILIKNKDIINIKEEALPKFNYLQSIVGKILDINQETKKIQLTVKFSEVFDNNVETAIDLFSRHLADLKYIKSFGFENEWKLCQYQPGERVICKIEQLGDEGGCLVTLPNDTKGLVAPHLCSKNVKPGQTLEGVFISEDFTDNYAEICVRQDISQRINKTQDGIIHSSTLSSCIAEHVITKNDSVIGVLKHDSGNRQFVYIPLYLHENDNNGSLKYYEQSKFKVCICGKVGNYLIGMSKKLFLSLEKQKEKIEKHKTIRKNKADINLKTQNLLENDDESKIKVTSSLEDDSGYSISLVSKDGEIDIEDSEEDSYESDASEGVSEKSEGKKEQIQDDYNREEVEQSYLKGRKGIKRKTEVPTLKNIKFGNETVKNYTTSDSITGPLPVLPGVSSFFNTSAKVENESSSDEEEEVETVKKKKKLSPTERAELARKEEERISRIENELADSTKTPESAEQFDRLLLAKPDSSELWTQYMSFHAAATEFDKARSVAKRALESINITLIEERLNIWIALLNLENLLGTKESFQKTFEEAVKCNDSLQIYLSVIKMLAEAGKLSDMEEKIRKVRNKYKQEPTMWLEVARVYYLIKNFKEARNIKEASLKSIQDKQTQMNLIIRFAIMEFKYGEDEQGAAIFETILISDPRKVHVWTIYVDQLVKKDKIEQARKVLERSICQRLPLKSMKTLFLKFRMFEEKHGTPDSVEAVKEKAKEFVIKATEK